MVYSQARIAGHIHHAILRPLFCEGQLERMGEFVENVPTEVAETKGGWEGVSRWFVWFKMLDRFKMHTSYVCNSVPAVVHRRVSFLTITLHFLC